MGKVNPKNFNSDDLRSTQWVGIVEDTNDDIFEGRCKIRVYGKMEIFTNLFIMKTFILQTKLKLK